MLNAIGNITACRSNGIHQKRELLQVNHNHNASHLTSGTGDQFIKGKPAGLTHAERKRTHTSQKTHMPRFSGALSTLNATLGQPNEEGFQGTWPLTGKQLKNVVEIDQTPYVGQTPMMLQAYLGLNDKKLCHALDELADELRPDPDDEVPLIDRIIQELHHPTRNLIIHGRNLTLKKVGEGSFGVVYRLSNGADLTYAFKVHKNPDGYFDGYSDHSAYQEAATGQYLTAHNINKDVVRFYVANPMDGWSLTEFMRDYQDTGKREGKTLKEAGIAIGDDHFNNRISNVRVDLGGPVKPGEQTFDTATYFRVGTSW